MTTLELKQRAVEVLGRRRGACCCPNDRRDPHAVREGVALVVTVCRCCGGYTAPREA